MMTQTRILASHAEFSAEVARCCSEYESLNLAVAWCGNPKTTLQFQHFAAMGANVSALIGVAMHHTHPNIFGWLQKIGASYRVLKPEAALFHPKVYLFTSGERFALFIGSSNLTYPGFYANEEVNCLIEGPLADAEAVGLPELEARLYAWKSNKHSFSPSTLWIDEYREQYEEALHRAKKARVMLPQLEAGNESTTDWLREANWPVFYAKLQDTLHERSRTVDGYHMVLDAAASNIPLPWRASYFQSRDNRRIINGNKPFGWLGRVGSSGRAQGLFASGSPEKHRRIVDAINKIAVMDPPIDFALMSRQLRRLISLGPSMKVWGRLLCLARPDLYCTVSSESVRGNLAKTLSIPKRQFQTPEGYIALIRLIHASPWFQSPRPAEKSEARVWDRRVAFLDGILY